MQTEQYYFQTSYHYYPEQLVPRPENLTSPTLPPCLLGCQLLEMRLSQVAASATRLEISCAGVGVGVMSGTCDSCCRESPVLYPILSNALSAALGSCQYLLLPMFCPVKARHTDVSPS